MISGKKERLSMMEPGKKKNQGYGHSHVVLIYLSLHKTTEVRVVELGTCSCSW